MRNSRLLLQLTCISAIQADQMLPLSTNLKSYHFSQAEARIDSSLKAGQFIKFRCIYFTLIDKTKIANFDWQGCDRCEISTTNDGAIIINNEDSVSTMHQIFAILDLNEAQGIRKVFVGIDRLGIINRSQN